MNSIKSRAARREAITDDRRSSGSRLPSMADRREPLPPTEAASRRPLGGDYADDLYARDRDRPDRRLLRDREFVVLREPRGGGGRARGLVRLRRAGRLDKASAVRPPEAVGRPRGADRETIFVRGRALTDLAP